MYISVNRMKMFDKFNGQFSNVLFPYCQLAQHS